MLSLLDHLILPLNVSMHSSKDRVSSTRLFSRPGPLTLPDVRLEHFLDVFFFLSFLHLLSVLLPHLSLFIVSFEFLGYSPCLVLCHYLVMELLLDISHFQLFLYEFLFSLIVNFRLNLLLFLHLHVIDFIKLLNSHFLIIRFVLFHLQLWELCNKVLELYLIARLVCLFTLIF